MAKITRATQKQFGSTAGSNQLAKFGSLAAGSPQRYSGSTVTPADIQALANFLTGWNGAVIGSNSPAIEDMNALCYLFSYQLGYILQAGVQEYDATTVYYIGSFASDSLGGIYYSLTNANTGNALTDIANWRKISLPNSVAAKSSNFTLNPSTEWSALVTTGVSALTATLPTAIGIAGQRFRIQKIDTGSGSVQVLTTGGQVIGTFASGAIYLFFKTESIEVESDGANWQIVSRVNETQPTNFTQAINGSGSNPTKGTAAVDTAFWYKKGKFLRQHFEFHQNGAGATGSGVYLFPLAVSGTIDSIQTFGGGGSILGSCGYGRVAAGANNGNATVQSYDNGNFALFFYNSNLNPNNVLFAQDTTTPLNGSNVYFTFDAEVPMTNWS